MAVGDDDMARQMRREMRAEEAEQAMQERRIQWEAEQRRESTSAGDGSGT